MGDIDFKFNELQEKQYLDILKETKKVYPHLLEDEINAHRIKVIIAHHVICNDDKEKEDIIEVSEDTSARRFTI
jgi:hypothetical protein